MVVTASERQLMNAIRPKQLERRKALTSWNEVAFVNTELGPTLDITFDKMDEHIPVKRWRSGNPNLGTAEFVSDTGTVKAYFYGTEYAVPWWDDWLRTQASQRPNAADFADLNGERYRMERAMRRLVAEIERQIDTDFYNGNSAIEFGGMKAIDSSADTLSSTLDTVAGRKEFVNTVVSLSKDAMRVLNGGLPRLAIDHSVMPFMALPYEDTGSTGLSVNAVLSQFIDRIVPVQNTAMQNTAMLHWADPDNVEVFDLTPDGVQVLMGEPQRGEDRKARIFHMWTAKEMQAGSVEVIDGLLA